MDDKEAIDTLRIWFDRYPRDEFWCAIAAIETLAKVRELATCAAGVNHSPAFNDFLAALEELFGERWNDGRRRTGAALMARPEHWKDCTKECERVVYCDVCHSRKSPRGRSSPAECRYCDLDCPGYAKDPQPGHLWPGELADMDAEEIEVE